jgi:putative chitinase
VAAFVAQCAFDSRGLVMLEEGMLYRTPERIYAAWPERVSDPAHAERMVGAPQLLANTVYSGCWGNGDADSGDGWRYRGRGLIRLLGRATYRDAGAALGRPYEQQPELVARTEDACMTAAWLWHDRGLNELADGLEMDAIARHSRPAQWDALPERRALYRGTLATLEQGPGPAQRA